ncbi:MAG: phosphonopyruvate decarboxylase [Elusimicrobia bacterium]|nr:phosphonopyruvate decarboxylase [Candidatus Liberimonas magnetica]
MLNTKQFGEQLNNHGFNFYSGVPCSYLKSLINYAINEGDFIMAANEGDAVAICAGAFIGGKKSVFLCQNSGLTNAVSPLTSLNYIFKIPVLGFVSLRGEPGLKDEPQHELTGQITASLLDVMKIRWEYLSADMKLAEEQLEIAAKSIADNKSFFFVVKKDTFENEQLLEQKTVVSQNKISIEKTKVDTCPARIDVLKTIDSVKDSNTVLLATTGFTGRELYEIEDAENNFYMVGSMGCISSLALGLSVARKDKNIIAIDGDGSLLMRMGSIATSGSIAPSNMMHILLDNNAHESTGGQKTVSHSVNFTTVAAACGYTNSVYAHSLSELEETLANWKKNKCLTFIYIKIAKGTKENLSRPKISPREVKERFMKFIAKDVC